MFILILKIVTIWTAVALITGVVTAFLIGIAEKAHKDEFLNAMFATLAGERMVR
jgi:hypothetical protein